LARLLDTASEFALFSVSGLKDEKLILKKQTYTKTEACKLYSRAFWTIKPNVIKIDPYNCELYRFKVGAFLRHGIIELRRVLWSSCCKQRRGQRTPYGADTKQNNCSTVQWVHRLPIQSQKVCL